MIMPILSGIVCAVVVFLVIGEIVAWLVYGKILSDKETLPFLERYLQDYKLNDLAYPGTRLLYHAVKPYIANNAGFSLITYWHIADYGRIPFWSKSAKLLNKRWEELPKPVSPTLNNL